MTLSGDQVAIIREAAEFTDLEFRTSYPGRRMYGKTCIGVAGHAAGYTAFLVYVAGEDMQLAKYLTAVSTDDMGLGTIWYWPGLEA